jgi:hypothetical protein
MQVWLRSKLDHITQEFLDGGGYGGVYEAQFLAYLECLVAHWHGTPRVDSFWPEWRKVCAKATPEGKKVQALSNWLQDRKELVKALRDFQSQFDGPTPKRFRPPKQAQAADVPRSEPDLMDLLLED